eukprot:CAMPEP_0206300162 /NCGR_PEP_ID=MMETSP0106_2-20121207/7560_1 /ASSEMBLY_ACC=CAM_ASM_000206 /TAXON_ID=81532 /ORGANISM="Acanthoeca-like sp., Strain 10tr" /LENGTH=508 /DNA_ID=CAMNT_0053730879 /DNA_START=44 /DNA_END=1571 /DNA_ORIENTATION=-
MASFGAKAGIRPRPANGPAPGTTQVFGSDAYGSFKGPFTTVSAHDLDTWKGRGVPGGGVASAGAYPCARPPAVLTTRPKGFPPRGHLLSAGAPAGPAPLTAPPTSWVTTTSEAFGGPDPTSTGAEAQGGATPAALAAVRCRAVVPPYARALFPTVGSFASTKSVGQSGGDGAGGRLNAATMRLNGPPLLRHHRHLPHDPTPPRAIPGDRQQFDNRDWNTTTSEVYNVAPRPWSAVRIAHRTQSNSPRNLSIRLAPTLGRASSPGVSRPTDYPNHGTYSRRYSRTEARHCLTKVSVPTGSQRSVEAATSMRLHFVPCKFSKRAAIPPVAGDSNTLNVAKGTAHGSDRTTLHSAFRPRQFVAPPRPIPPRNTPGDAAIIPHASRRCASLTTTRAEFGPKAVAVAPTFVGADVGNKTHIKLAQMGPSTAEPFVSTQREAQQQMEAISRPALTEGLWRTSGNRTSSFRCRVEAAVPGTAVSSRPSQRTGERLWGVPPANALLLRHEVVAVHL